MAIRKALPRLQELTKGCIIKSKYYGEAELIHYDKDYFTYLFVCEKLQFRSDNKKYVEVIGHRIQLNDVLEWALYFRMYSASDKPICEIIDLWNMEHNFLDKQGDRIIKILNTL